MARYYNRNLHARGRSLYDGGMSNGPLPSPVPAVRMSTARSALLAFIQERGEPVSVKDLSEASGQHPNTVREHLEALVEAGLVDRRDDIPQGRGRPAGLYTPRASATPLHGAREYAVMAEALAAHLKRTADDPVAEAIDAGYAWGEQMATTTDDPMTALTELGFSPERIDDTRIRLTRCPMLGAAQRNPEVICNVHQGLLKALIGEQVVLTSFVTDGCMVDLPEQ